MQGICFTRFASKITPVVQFFSVFEYLNLIFMHDQELTTGKQTLPLISILMYIILWEKSEIYIIMIYGASWGFKRD